MGLTGTAIKSFIQLGGTGVPWITPASRDIVLTSPWDTEGAEDGIRVTGETALTYIPFFAGVRLISEDVASLPFGVYRKLPGGGREERDQHPLHTLIHDQPNPYMTSMSLREVMQAHVLTWGNAYAEKEYATDGTLLGLWPLRPDRMQVLVETSTGRPFYRYRLLSGEQRDLSWRQIFHVHGLGSDGLVGYSIIALARRALGMAISSERYGTAYMQRGTIPPAILKTTKELNEGDIQRLRTSWDQIDHRNRVAILEEGVDFQIVGLPPKDVQLLESGDHLRSLMATLLRLPPHMLSDVDRSTSWGTGIEQQGIGYVKHTLRPTLHRWEQETKLRLLDGDGDHYVRFSVDALLRGDTAARWQAYTAGINNGVYTVNDVLALEDRNPISEEAGGNIRRAPLNMVPLDQWRDASLKDRIEMLRLLVAAGFQPEASAEAVGVPEIEHTGLEPVTVGEQGPYTNGSSPAEEPAR